MSLTASQLGKVAVLMGGTSAEREVSLNSGREVLTALRNRSVDAHKVDPDEDLLRQLDKGGFDRAFVVLHGRGGEDGVVQALLETLGIPYTGSGVAGSALGMDKYRCKLLWLGLGLPTAAFKLIKGEQDLAAAADIGFPLIVKPAREGSSIGMTRVESSQHLRKAWELAGGYDSEVLAERWIEGPEYTASILGDRVLPLIRIETPRVFYDYEAKYQADSTLYHCPCGLPEAEESALRRLSMAAFESVGASGWGRVDMMLDERGDPYLLEVNTVPGMTDHSLVPMAARAAGMDFDELVWQILVKSLERG